MVEERELNLFGDLMRNWRKSRKWTIEVLASKLCEKGFVYDSSTLGKYERKERTPDGTFLAHLTCIGLAPEQARDWALAIGRATGIDTVRSFLRAKQQLGC